MKFWFVSLSSLLLTISVLVPPTSGQQCTSTCTGSAEKWIDKCGWDECQACPECAKYSETAACTSLAHCHGLASSIGWDNTCKRSECNGCTLCFLSPSTGSEFSYEHYSQYDQKWHHFKASDCTEYASIDKYGYTLRRNPVVQRLKLFNDHGFPIQPEGATDGPDWWNSGTPAQKECKANMPILSDIEEYGWFEKQDGWKINIFNRLFQENSDILSWKNPDDWKHGVCYAQHAACTSIPELDSTRTPECHDAFDGCRAAFRHLHKMMFKESANIQQCNNFALKSIRGFFHDSITSWVEGSILHEVHLDMNTGLCRWAQYISVLSDHTKCDPGSIITLAAVLGYQSCGVDLYNHRFNNNVAYHPLRINRPYACQQNVNEDINYPPDHPDRPLEKREKFSDINLMSDSGIEEEFWANIMRDTGRPFEMWTDTGMWSRYYLGSSVTASLHAHAVGRVTCPGNLNKHYTSDDENIRAGFWDRDRIDAVGEKRLKRTWQDASNRLVDTQCDRGNFFDCMANDNEACKGFFEGKTQNMTEEEFKAFHPQFAESTNWTECERIALNVYNNCPDINTGPIRSTREIDPTKAVWTPFGGPPSAEETNVNVEASFCQVPMTSFKKIGGIHFVDVFPMWKSLYADKWSARKTSEFIIMHNVLGTRTNAVDYSEWQKCKKDMAFSVPYELSQLSKTPVPTSPALRQFELIAWDGVGTIDSAWDSCTPGCDNLPTETNSLCGGNGMTEFRFDYASTCSSWGSCEEGAGDCVKQYEDEDSPLTCCVDNRWSKVADSLVCKFQQEEGRPCSHNQFCKSEQCAHTLQNDFSPTVCCSKITWANGTKVCRGSVPGGGYCTNNLVCSSGTCIDDKCENGT